MLDSSRWATEHSNPVGPRNTTNRANRVMEGMAADAAISQFAFRLSQMQGLPEELRQQAWELYRFLTPRTPTTIWSSNHGREPHRGQKPQRLPSR